MASASVNEFYSQAFPAQAATVPQQCGSPVDKKIPHLWDIMGRAVPPEDDEKTLKGREKYGRLRGAIVRVSYTEKNRNINNVLLCIGSKSFHVSIPEAGPALDVSDHDLIKLVYRVCRFNPTTLGWMRHHLTHLGQRTVIPWNTAVGIVDLVERYKLRSIYFDHMIPAPPVKRCKIKSANVVMYYQDPKTRAQGDLTQDVLFVRRGFGIPICTANTTHQQLVKYVDWLSKRPLKYLDRHFLEDPMARSFLCAGLDLSEFKEGDPSWNQDQITGREPWLTLAERRRTLKDSGQRYGFKQISGKEPGWKATNTSSSAYSADARRTGELFTYTSTNSDVPIAPLAGTFFVPERDSIEEPEAIDPKGVVGEKQDSEILHRIWTVWSTQEHSRTPIVKILYTDPDFSKGRGELHFGGKTFRMSIPVSKPETTHTTLLRLVKVQHLWSLDVLECLTNTKRSCEINAGNVKIVRQEKFNSVSQPKISASLSIDNKQYSLSATDVDLEDLSHLAIRISLLCPEDLERLTKELPGQDLNYEDIDDIIQDRGIKYSPQVQASRTIASLTADLWREQDRLKRYRLSHLEATDETSKQGERLHLSQIARIQRQLDTQKQPPSITNPQ